MGQDVPEEKRVMEINPDHALIKKIAEESEKPDFNANDWSSVLMGLASIADGQPVPDGIHSPAQQNARKITPHKRSALRTEGAFSYLSEAHPVIVPISLNSARDVAVVAAGFVVAP